MLARGDEADWWLLVSFRDLCGWFAELWDPAGETWHVHHLIFISICARKVEFLMMKMSVPLYHSPGHLKQGLSFLSQMSHAATIKVTHNIYQNPIFFSKCLKVISDFPVYLTENPKVINLKEKMFKSVTRVQKQSQSRGAGSGRGDSRIRRLFQMSLFLATRPDEMILNSLLVPSWSDTWTTSTVKQNCLWRVLYVGDPR